MTAVRWVVQLWRDTPAGLRVAAVAMWVAGVAMTALGWIGDSVGFWSTRPFLTNLMSTATGAAFGIPLALLVLQRIAAGQAELAEARTARRLARQAVQDMYRAVTSIIVEPGNDPAEKIAELIPIVKNLDEWDGKVHAAYRAAVDYDDNDKPIMGDEKAYQEWRSLEAAANDAREAAVARLTSVVDFGRLPAAKAELLGHWEHLIRDVQPTIRTSRGTFPDAGWIKNFTSKARGFPTDLLGFISTGMWERSAKELAWLRDLMADITFLETFFSEGR